MYAKRDVEQTNLIKCSTALPRGGAISPSLARTDSDLPPEMGGETKSLL